MKATSGSVMIVFLGLVSCFNPPEYPVIPEIEFDNVSYIDVPDGMVDSKGFPIPDTLLLKVKFKDGDGDIGVNNDPNDNTGKYAERFYFNLKDRKKYYLLQNASSLDIANNLDFIKYSTRRTNPNYDTLPAYIDPYKCENWEIVVKAGVGSVPSVTIDTVYFQLNPNHYNIFVDFMVLKNDNSGEYEEYDFRKEFCTTFNGRVPIIAKEQDSDVPLQGVMNYGMVSTVNGFKLFFGNRTIKLRVQVQDRALNKSNVILTDGFTISGITRK